MVSYECKSPFTLVCVSLGKGNSREDVFCLIKCKRNRNEQDGVFFKASQDCYHYFFLKKSNIKERLAHNIAINGLHNDQAVKDSF